MKTTIPALALLIAVAACTQAPAPTDPSVITSRADQWEEALNAGDVEGIVGLYTEDTRLMAPNAETKSGHDAIRSAFSEMIEGGVTGDLETVDVSVSGDTGYRVGTYTTWRGDEVVDTGKFIETWRRGTDGVWRIANDIWNSDKPQAPARRHGQHREHEGMRMAHVMILHDVEDGDHWQRAWSGDNRRHDMFRANGAGHVHTFRSNVNPNLTGLVIAVRDMAAFQAMLGSEEGAKAAAEDGVDLDNMTMLISVP